MTPGAVVDYVLEPSEGRPDAEAKEAKWFAFNDAQAVTIFRPTTIQGPTGPQWKGAKWSAVGHHRIVCHIKVGGSTKIYTYEQWVVPVAAELLGGPRLPQDPTDPDATLDTLNRFIGILQAVAKKYPPQSKPEQEKFEQTLSQQEMFRDKLSERLKSTVNFRKHTIHAEHFEAQSQRRAPLRVFLAKVASDKWVIVDWTNPMARAATGEYSGEGRTPEEAVRNALVDWDEDNRYPDGGITVKIPTLSNLNLPAIEKEFQTDGSAYWDSVSSFFGWVGLGAAVVAGVVTLVAPVPGSQIVSAAIWTGIFSSTAAAAINIGTRIDEGFSSWKANAFDVLSIVANLFGAGSILWSRGAATVININNKAVKFVLIGAITTDGVQGVMLGFEYAKEFDAIQKDPTISPQERTDRLVRLFGSALANGLLLYISVKGSKSDLESMNLKGSIEGATTPAERLKKLGDPNETLDLTAPLKVEGKAGEKPHVTKVHIDQEMQTPHVGAHSVKPRAKAEPKRMGPQRTSNLDALYAEAEVAKKELDVMTRSIAQDLGGEAMIPATLKGSERAKEKIAADYEGDASRISDLARASISFKSVSQLEKGLAAIKAKVKIVRLKDRFQNPQNGYRDILMNLEMSNGHVVEMQLHLASILNVKNGEGHKLYELERKIQAKAAAEKRSLNPEETIEVAKLQTRAKELYDEAFLTGKGAN